MPGRVGGTIHLKAGGVVLRAKGSFSYDIGGFLREEVMGQVGIDGFTEVAVPGYIEGEITDDGSVDVKALRNTKNATVTLALANGKTVVLNKAFAAGEWTGQTEAGNMSVKFVGEGEEF